MMQWDFNVMAERLINDGRWSGPGLAAYFVKGALDRGIALHTGVSAEELIHDGERVVGVRAKRHGRDLYVKARRGVIIRVSSYERDPSLAKTPGHQHDQESMVMAPVDAAHLRLAGALGGRLARLPDVTI